MYAENYEQAFEKICKLTRTVRSDWSVDEAETLKKGYPVFKLSFSQFGQKKQSPIYFVSLLADRVRLNFSEECETLDFELPAPADEETSGVSASADDGPIFDNR